MNILSLMTINKYLRLPAFYVIFLAIVYITLTIILSVHFLHDAYQSSALDLGIFAQTCKYTLEGKLLYNTIEGSCHLAYHFSPILLVLIPFYWIFPHVQTLLVIQAILFGFSGCLVYLLCRVNNLNHKTGIFIELLFFLNPLLWGTALFDFHEVAFAVPALLIMFIGIKTQRWVLIIIGLVVAISSKEDVIITIAIFGFVMLAYTFWKGKKVNRIYFSIFVSSIIAYGIAVGASTIASDGEFPHILTYGSTRFEYINLPLGESIIGGAKTFFSKDSLLLFLAYLAPLGFLPLLSFPWSLAGLVVLLENMLSTCPNQHAMLLQSQTPAIPFLYLGCIMAVTNYNNKLNIRNVVTKFEGRIYIYLLIILAAVSFQYISTTRIQQARVPFNHEKALNYILTLVPDGSSVTANNSIFPHICDRTDAYLPYWEDPYTPITSGDWGYPDKDTEYLIVDWMHKQYYKNGSWENMIKDKIGEKYELVKNIEGTKLYRLREPVDNPSN